MKITPRDYQQAAHDSVIEWWRKTADPCVVEAATGAGKSIIIAMLAHTLHSLSGGKRVLCLAPSKELIEQNSEKYGLLGEPYSIYSASISKSLRHQVVFATEGTFKKVAKRLGHEFSGVIVDEAHKTTPTIKNIIDDMREGNPNLRVCGLSATPYRLGDGFIFAMDDKGDAIPESQARDPYYKKLVYYIGAPELIKRGYLTPACVGDINATEYDTSSLVVQNNGQFSKKSIEQAFHGWGRETAGIVVDVVAQAADKRGVMLFAATVEHAKEIMASLPPHNSRMIGGNVNMKAAERKALVDDFKAQRFKYLVSVGTMTTGVDFAHVDLIAILRATESISLLQQIIGRGLRLCDTKSECLILDYAGNIERHCPDGDIFKPEIKAAYQGSGENIIECRCPECDGLNLFSARPNDMGAEIDSSGYFVDLDGNQMLDEESQQPFPAHFGRRCQAHHYSKETKSFERCGYYWSSKECPECQHFNDIAARRCGSCKAELINPNDKLIALHRKLKRDPTQMQCDELVGMEVIKTISRAGNEMLKVTYYTSRRMFPDYYQTEPSSQWQADKTKFFMDSTNGGKDQPRTVRYKKEGDFYKVFAFNEMTDDERLERAIS